MPLLADLLKCNLDKSLGENDNFFTILKLQSNQLKFGRRWNQINLKGIIFISIMWLKCPGWSSRQWELPFKLSFLIISGLSVWYLTGSWNNAKVTPGSSDLLDFELRGRGEMTVAAPAALLSGGGLSWPSHQCNASFTSRPGPSAFLSTSPAAPQTRGAHRKKKKNTGLSFKTLRLVCSASFCFHFHPRASLSELLQNSQQSGGKVIPVERNTNKIKWLKLKMPTPRRTGGVWVCMCVSMAAIVDLADMCAAAAHVCVRVCAAG